MLAVDQQKSGKKEGNLKKYRVLLNHVAIAQIHEAIIASTDGNVWIYLNAKHDYTSAEPEPIAKICLHRAYCCKNCKLSTSLISPVM